MELKAVIEGLKALNTKCMVTVYSDSKYIVDAVKKGWLNNWAEKGWKRKKDKLSNPDLWQELYLLLAKHEVEFNWIEGHKGNIENERCDYLAVRASQNPKLPPDIIFEANSIS
jgi:ribonuclease HI